MAGKDTMKAEDVLLISDLSPGRWQFLAGTDDCAPVTCLWTASLQRLDHGWQGHHEGRRRSADIRPISGQVAISRGISARCEQGVPRDCGLVAIWRNGFVCEALQAGGAPRRKTLG